VYKTKNEIETPIYWPSLPLIILLGPGHQKAANKFQIEEPHPHQGLLDGMRMLAEELRGLARVIMNSNHVSQSILGTVHSSLAPPSFHRMHCAWMLLPRRTIFAACDRLPINRWITFSVQRTCSNALAAAQAKHAPLTRWRRCEYGIPSVDGVRYTPLQKLTASNGSTWQPPETVVRDRKP
jgi:hypothetical protein